MRISFFSFFLFLPKQCLLFLLVFFFPPCTFVTAHMVNARACKFTVSLCFSFLFFLSPSDMLILPFNLLLLLLLCFGYDDFALLWLTSI